MRKNRDIKLVSTERRRNYIVSEPNYYTIKFFIKNLLAIVIKKSEILRNKPVYLGPSILELNKILMYQFDFVKPKYAFIVYIKTDDTYKDITGDVEARFDTLIFELECNSIKRLLQKCKHKKVIRLIKYELVEK